MRIGLLSLLLLAALALHSQATNPDISKLKSAAEAGDSSAQVALGRAHQNGQGVEENDAIAVDWYRKAALAGSSEGQNDLGVMYMNGWGVEKNKEEAVHWYRLAAKQKNAHAMFNLGAAYYNGDGVGINDVSAAAWFVLAKENGSEKAADAVQRAQTDLHADTLDGAMLHIAEMYIKGDRQEATKYLRTSAGHGDVPSQILLAQLLMTGDGTVADYTEARHWCEAASKTSKSNAGFCLGEQYRRGLGGPRDAKKALNLIRVAADAGNVEAMEVTGEMLESGEGGKIDREASLLYFLRAILGNRTDALPKAAKVRSEMTDKEWKKAQVEMKNLRIDPVKVDAALQKIQPVSSSR